MSQQYETLFYLGNEQEGFELVVDRDDFSAKSLPELREKIEAAGYKNFELELLED